jgi:Domain of unknown function (DUF4365)
MSETKSHPEYVGRRGELLAELFLQDLKPEFVARATGDVGYDFLVGFRNLRGGVNSIAVEIKATERLVQNRFPLRRKQYRRFAYSNIPVLFIVVDVKDNRFFYAWISSDDAVASSESNVVMIRLTEIDESTKEELRKQLET